MSNSKVKLNIFKFQVMRVWNQFNFKEKNKAKGFKNFLTKSRKKNEFC